jgi:aromatic ring-opening dioxygenase catalytic subunit (LigB family)
MNWNALVGALIGAGIPSSLVAYIALRRGRQSADAETFGPAVLLLIQIDPDRVTVNISRDAGVEAERWKGLEEQRDKARERLLIISSGNPRRRVRKLAAAAEVKLTRAFHGSELAVHDQLRNRDDGGEWIKIAKHEHAEAMAAMQDLVSANLRWSGRPRRRRKALAIETAPASSETALPGAPTTS